MGNLPKYLNSVFAAVLYSYAVMKVLTGLGNKNIKEAPPQPPPEAPVNGAADLGECPKYLLSGVLGFSVLSYFVGADGTGLRGACRGSTAAAIGCPRQQDCRCTLPSRYTLQDLQWLLCLCALLNNTMLLVTMAQHCQCQRPGACSCSFMSNPGDSLKGPPGYCSRLVSSTQSRCFAPELMFPLSLTYVHPWLAFLFLSVATIMYACDRFVSTTVHRSRLPDSPKGCVKGVRCLHVHCCPSQPSV